jgi:hypothetical protein
MEPFVKRWIVRVSPGRYAMTDDFQDTEDWDDTVLEVSIPATAAFMFDSIMHSWYVLQEYMNAQWELMEHKLALEEDGYEQETGGVSADDLSFMTAFNAIIKSNSLENIADKVLDDPNETAGDEDE